MPHNESERVMYSALEVAKLCGVVNQTAINWIRSNHLRAFNTPGGQYRVRPEDLVEFMQSRNIQVPSELKAVCCGYGDFPRSVLIVDDDRGLNSVVAMFIKKRVEGLSVYQAFDGFEAGSIMTEMQPGIVLLDLDLPGIDGFDLCRRINENEKFGNPTIIVITAIENDDAETKMRELGVHTFIKKPLDLPGLVDIINNILKK